MIPKMRRILVSVGNPARVPPAQLSKAAALARSCGARIELFHAITEPVLVDAATGPLPDVGHDHDEITALRQLERLAHSEIFRGIAVRCVAIHDYPAYEAISARAGEIEADLVIAATRPAQVGGRLFLANTDRQLIRHCDTPLLLIRSNIEHDSDEPVVLTAIDPFQSAELDTRLMEYSERFAALLGGEEHVFHATPSLVTTNSWLSPALVDLHITDCRRAFDELAQRAHIPATRRHFRVGNVPSQLTTTATELRATLVVMGVVPQSRLMRLILGNTPEQALDQLTCDVLIIKPRAATATNTEEALAMTQKAA